MSVHEVSTAILEFLRREMRHFVAPDQIGLCSPAGCPDTFLLGLFPYNIARDNKFQMNKSIVVDSNTAQFPPICVEASFMVTSYIGKKSGIADDLKLLDRVLQIWHDNAAIPFRSELQPQYVAAPRVELLSLDADTISKIWQFPGSPYRASLFYKAAPIAVASAKQAATPRVREAELRAGGREDFI